MDGLTITTAASSGSEGSGILFLVFLIIYFAVGIFYIATLWIAFAKKQQPGWASLIPFYNIYIMLTIAEKPAWMLVLLFVPLGNLYIFYVFFKAYGYNDLNSILFTLFPFIGLPIVAFTNPE